MKVYVLTSTTSASAGQPLNQHIGDIEAVCATPEKARSLVLIPESAWRVISTSFAEPYVQWDASDRGLDWTVTEWEVED